ncbi:MAG TPA: PAS domain-containing protein, partial [Candidatus Brocadiales bacterium]|nr:PAS domain-containing protein [Candidatus Brocadiales bacterium]
MNYEKMTRSDLIKELKSLKSSMEIAERKQAEKELKRLSDTLEQNVGKYKKVEKEFRMSQSRFSRIFNSNMMGIAFWDISGEITHANDAFLNIVGYTRRNLQSGKVNWLRMTPREHAHLDRKGIEEVKTRGFCTP